MISTKFLGTGTLMLIIGIAAVAAFSVKLVPDPNIYTVGMGMGALGLLCMIIGLLMIAFKAFAPQKGLEKGDTAAFSVGLIRCMLAISIADDHLDDSEIEQIAKIYKHLTGATMDEETIRYTAGEMMEHGVDIQAELQTLSHSLDHNLKDKLIRASLFILTADGEMDEDELITLDDIRLGIGMSLKQLDKIQKDFMKKQNVRKVRESETAAETPETAG